MKRILSALAAAIALLFPLLCLGEPAPAAETALFAVSAGKADALILKTADKAFLIDAGYARSRGKILYAMELLGITGFDGAVLTHNDRDHAEGLEWLSESDIPVGTWYASAYYTGIKKESKHPAVAAAANRGQSVVWLRRGDALPLGDAVLRVLAPETLFTDKDDNNSLVLMLETPHGRILLAGDMEYPEEDVLLASGQDLKCDVLKVPNHADDDTASAAFLAACAPKFAVITTDSVEKPGTPDPYLMERLYDTGATVLETQDAEGGVLVTMGAEGIRTELIGLPETAEHITVAATDSERDLITLKNAGGSAVDLGGWYLIPDRKNILFVIPQGTVLAPGQSLTVGGSNADAAADLTWNVKRVLNKKKDDGVTLYDAYGNAVSYRADR
ncbi:MAG: lamin tail domain-containing protein [Clostridia bacterium]|nr:lamin tail domain-containing protein [Clostridia bacterium]